MLPERQLTGPVSLCLPNGRLNPDAVGWARTPLVNTDGVARGPRPYAWGRNKRWEYWGITTPTHLIGLTVSSIDYAGVHELWVFDRDSRKEVAVNAVVPLARDVVLPGTLGAGPASARAKVPLGELRIDIDEVAGGTRLTASAPRVSLDIVATRPDGRTLADHEAMGVVVPWSRRLFQYTVKDVDRPAMGTLTIDGVEHGVPAGESWAVLDHGRGRWPYSVAWNWGAASGFVGWVGEQRRVGVQLGAKWTDGTGSTENAITVDGRVHKISEELVWEYRPGEWMTPWHIKGERVDATFTPFHLKQSSTQLGVIASSTRQCFGHYSGWIATDDGAGQRIDGLLGWAEDVHNRW
ncbi:DUF2804 domain-containing protein [Humibacter ginsenosidimutans]|uniref:DUF2804 domain-containing protein n=1 Tax=Humibacter ginsenosidimutans TaxID=2599293 RepID=A0A5B8M7A9_9MICO|nr:DUF2804 domain-containing protein [Humibacter ginsenosidimutans]QDZ16081.1 DUF2804 domain-containing protein [Humibacter ginsenosidimutans]